jgi:hypothetical protein
MNNFNISRLSFTDLFWRVVFSNGTVILDQAKSNILSKHMQIEGLRKSAEYNTGSISLASSVSLALLSNYFRPKIVAEVGTFIGRSTYSLALGPSLSGQKAPTIHTCDFSNDIRINFDSTLEEVVQYPKKSSTEMFQALLDKKIFPDVFLLDGRVQEADIPLLMNLRAENAVFILDDFEGTEKGVYNAFALTNIFKNNFMLAYPPSNSFLCAHGLTDASTTAVLLPQSRIKYVNQA